LRRAANRGSGKALARGRKGATSGRGRRRTARSRVRATSRVLVSTALLLGLLVVLAWLRGALVERLVQVIMVREGALDRVAGGRALVARRETVVLAPADGVLHWLVATGERVRAGTVVAELGNPMAVEAALRDQALLEQRLAEAGAALAPLEQELAGLRERLAQAAGRLRSATIRGDAAEVAQREAELGSVLAQHASRQADRLRIESTIHGLKENLRAQQQLVQGLTVRVVSPVAGVLVRELDGLEQTVAPRQLSRLSSRQLMAFEPRPGAPEEGQTVRAATPLFKVVDSLEAYACLALPVRDVEQLEVSRPVNVRFPDIHDDVVRGQVYHLGERERNGLVLVVVKLEEAPDALAVRREVEVLLVLETYRGTVVPRRALLGRNGRTGVLVVVRNTARFQAVEVLGGDARQVVVTGLPAGTEVVLNPWLLREGSRIR